MGLTGRPGPMVSHLGGVGVGAPHWPLPIRLPAHWVRASWGRGVRGSLGTRGPGCPQGREALALVLTTTLPRPPRGSKPLSFEDIYHQDHFSVRQTLITT